jgi:four helix bundle protein
MFVMGTYRDLIVYRKAYDLAMRIFHTSKKFPPEEKYSLTDQVRRSSRSVCANLVEAYRRRRYKDFFISKLNDSQTENGETQVWLDFAKDCNYIENDEYLLLTNINEEVGKLTWFMINNPDKFI